MMLNFSERLGVKGLERHSKILCIPISLRTMLIHLAGRAIN